MDISEKQEIPQNIKPSSSTQRGLTVQVILLCIGFLMTVSAFLFANLFIQKTIKTEYTNLAGQTALNVAYRFSSLQETFNAVGSILSATPSSEIRLIAQKIKETVPHTLYFDHLIWAEQTENGGWRFQTIYLKENSTGALRKIETSQTLVSYLTLDQLPSYKNVSVFTNAPFIKTFGNPDNTIPSAHPFALFRSFQTTGNVPRLLIGLSNPSLFLDSEWHTHQIFLSDITIKDIQDSRTVYAFSSPSPDQSMPENYTYEFIFGDQIWSLELSLFKKRSFLLLEKVPLFILIFGFTVSGLIAIYLRQNTQQSTRVRHVYQTVEEKTKELQAQMHERQKLHETLEETERENRAIIDAVSDIIFETDDQGVIVFLNRRWKTITGFYPEQSKGLDLFSVLHPEDQKRLQKDFRDLLEGQIQTIRSFTRLRTSTGRFRAVELSISMIHQGHTAKPRVVGTLTDVEERRRAEHALSEAEKKYRAIVENAAGGIFQVTPEGLYLSVNPAMANILGYNAPDEILRHIKNAHQEIYVNHHKRQTFLRDLEQRGAINNHETQVYKKDGQIIWVSENIRTVKDDDNNTLYYEGSLEDITQRKSTDLALREAKIHSDLANRAKSEFLANMSHELRTPLNSIIGFSEIIKSQAFGPIEQDSYLEYADNIHKSGNRLLEIITEILDISKIEAKNRKLNESIVDIQKINQTCLSLLENKIKESDLVINTVLEDMPHIIGEDLAIKQILMNLLSNAIKFTPNGGRITIAYTRDTDNSLRLSITDTGVGLTEDEIQKALSPFGQIQNELSRTNSGTGLGLTLVDALIKLHGGSLEIFSQKGIGTTATIVFPGERVTLKTSSEKNYAETIES